MLPFYTPSLYRKSSAAFTTTNTEPKLCLNAPVTGVRIPAADRITAVTLMIIDMMMLVFTFCIVFLVREVA